MQEEMDIHSYYDIAATAAFLHSQGFKRVALQFPDELLKHSVKVVTALRKEIQSLIGNSQVCSTGTEKGVSRDVVQLYVMADTTYSSCCVDEVGAAHANVECVVHYGPACFSPTSRLPAWFVFGKASIDVKDCAECLLELLSSTEKPLLVLFGLEYAYAIERLKEEVRATISTGKKMNSELIFSEVLCSAMDPSLPVGKSIISEDGSKASECATQNSDHPAGTTREHCLGGLKWVLPEHHKMEDYLLVWIGQEGPALSNVMLTYNACGVARYDSLCNTLLKDVPSQSKMLKRRYYLVEQAKDADIVGIVVGTLGVAGYREAIRQLKILIKEAGKKSYTFVMGRPNPAKLANFPECNVFVYVACAQTALLDSKEFLAPLITPFEAVLAFRRGSQWTGSYFLDFEKLVESSAEETKEISEEVRFSFIKGGYVKNEACPDDVEESGRAIMLASVTEKALQLHENSTNSLAVKGPAKSGAEFLSSRSYQGLEIGKETEPSYSYIKGRSGRAWEYEEEANR